MHESSRKRQPWFDVDQALLIGDQQPGEEGRQTMEPQDRHAVITGGTGALGTAVVGRLLAAGAICHVPYRSAAQPAQFPYRDRPGVTLVMVQDLADEAGVDRFYSALPPLWASIHVAGGFRYGPGAATRKAAPLGQLGKNIVGCFPGCPAAP